MKIRATIAAIALASLAGCGTPGPAITVRVPIPVACQEAMPDRPAMPTEQLQAGQTTLHQYVRASQAEIERREGYELRLRTALAACITPLAAAGPR